MPDWVLLIGQIGSYLAGLPLLLATAYGAAVIVSRSGIRWDLVSGLCFLSVWGWAAGILPAIVDAVIPINSVMHNTLWVPGHFHFYTLLGLVAMLVAFMRHITQGAGNGESLLDKLAFWAFAVGGLGFVMIFLWGGLDSVPRRWAVHLPEWLGLNQAGSIFAAIVVLAMLVLLLRFFQQLKNVQIVHEES